MIVQLMTSLLIISFIIQLAYYFFVFSGVLFYKDTNNKKKHPPVSVIISSRNDALNLSSFLPFVVKQNYPVFEVIVMNDGSDDNTNEVLSNLSDKYNNLKFFESGNKKGNKKQSLTEAIKKARYDYLLFTDSDCRPVSDKWIKNMISRYDDDTEIVIGYGGYETHKTFLNNMI
ncbi:MAG: glycosyltransferase, partial [Chlorobi bacterium]|nr:glycosyltransferase [Chlorobiota bacterium]